MNTPITFNGFRVSDFNFKVSCEFATRADAMVLLQRILPNRVGSCYGAALVELSTWVNGAHKESEFFDVQYGYRYSHTH